MTHSVFYDWQIFCQQEFGGVSRYFAELAARVDGLPGWRARVVAPLHINEHLRASGARTVGTYLAPRLRRSKRKLHFVNRCAARIVKELMRPDVIHRTYYCDEARDAKSRLVVTVYDMIHEQFMVGDAHDTTSSDKRRNVAQADHVICISHSTAHDLIRLFDVPTQKISVVHLGFANDFGSRAGDVRPPEHSRPYLLYVGQRAGYKNFAGALRAYADSPRLRRDFDFVTFGGFPFSSEETAAITELGFEPGSVRRIAGSDDQLASAYRHAHAFVYPSLYEGFGIPPLEAMGSGCPVACSNTSSIPEVVGDAAEMFDPNDRESMRAAIERICYDDARRSELGAAGRHRLASFSWQRCAAQTAAVYARVLG